MQPAFQITANGNDFTDTIRDRLTSLSITDEAGVASDELTLVLDNRGRKIGVPRTGTKLSAAIGYDGVSMVQQGDYVVDEVATTLSPATMTIKAKAADMKAGLKVKKTRSFEDETIGDLVALVAAEHGLKPHVSPELSNILLAPPPYLQFDQTHENDMHMLLRLAIKYDAIASPKSGYLVFVKKGQDKTVLGAILPTHTVYESECITGRARVAERGKYEAVKAYYLDAITQERVSVSTSAEQPVLVLSGTMADANTAELAVHSRLDALQRGKATLSLTIIGRAEIAGGHKLDFKTTDELAAGLWIITRVQHTIKDGFQTMIEAESPKEVT